jgi:glutamate transport system permease protein
MRFVLSHSDIFWSGLQLSLWLAVISGVLSLLFGSMLAIMRVSPLPVLRRGATVYVEIVRNTPLTILFFSPPSSCRNWV